jgi:hypothetical protein
MFAESTPVIVCCVRLISADLANQFSAQPLQKRINCLCFEARWNTLFCVRGGLKKTID